LYLDKKRKLRNTYYTYGDNFLYFFEGGAEKEHGRGDGGCERGSKKVIHHGVVGGVGLGKGGIL
jgi:hypothetical protein